MKINVFPTIIAIALSALLSYGLFAFCHTSSKENILAIGGFVCFAISLIIALAVRFNEKRTSVNTAVLGWVFFIILMVSHIIYAFVQFSTPAYVIVNGIILLVFIGITYAVAKAKQ